MNQNGKEQQEAAAATGEKNIYENQDRSSGKGKKQTHMTLV